VRLCLEHFFHVAVCRYSVLRCEGFGAVRDAVADSGERRAWNLPAAEKSRVPLRNSATAD
jgi:hypothetical protein